MTQHETSIAHAETLMTESAVVVATVATRGGRWS